MLLHEIKNYLETNEHKRKKPETVEEMEKRIVETVDGIILATRAAFTSDLLNDIQKPEDVVNHTHNVLTAFMVRTLGWEEKRAKKHILETAAGRPDFAEFLLTALLKADVAKRKKE